jgi:hypothetical protein
MKEICVVFGLISQALNSERRLYFLESFGRQGTNFAAVRLMFKFSVKMGRHVSHYTHNITNIVKGMPFTRVDDFTQFFHIFISPACDWRPERSKHSVEVWSLLKREYYLKVYVILISLLRKAFLRISWASEAGCPRLQQNLMTFCIP